MEKFNEKELLTLVNIYLDPENTSEEEIDDRFKEKGFNFDDAVNKIEELLTMKPSEIKLSKGKKLGELLNYELINCTGQNSGYRLASGFRKKENNSGIDFSDLDSVEDKRKLEALRKLSNGKNEI